jgi:hypothetical protein
MLKKTIKVDTNLEIWQVLRPRKCEDLTRVGGCKDGGYLVPLKYLKNLTTFVNFGVGEDFDFEIELRKKYGVSNIYSFDSLVSKKYFTVHFVRGVAKFFMFRCRIRVVFQRLVLLSKFISFYTFSSKVKFFKVKLDELNTETILSDLPQKSAIKVDIEGDEYAILNTICANKSKFNFIIMEFHSIQLNQKIISDFIKNLDSHFFVAHLSINNRTSDIDFLPNTIEVTLCSGTPKYSEFIDELPNDKLDWNFSNKPTYQLNYI